MQQGGRDFVNVAPL